MDYETCRLGGLECQVVPTPGVTNGASSYIVNLRGRRLAFVGEVISGPGRISRIAPLQYNYNDFNGAVNLWHSCNRLLALNPVCLLPSLGEPMYDPVAAIGELKENLRSLDDIQPGLAAGFTETDEDDVEEILPHLYRSKSAVASTHFVISDSGRVLSLDYGYPEAALAAWPARHHSSNRRPMLHGLRGIEKRCGSNRVDTVLVTHFHDDHINGIPMLQRLFQTEVWAARHFSDILERPERYDRPCLWHEPIKVARHLPVGQTIYWENIPITLHPMSGHTRFSTLILMEIDGVRVAHTGDQIFFRSPQGNALTFEPGARLFTNHVYKNGLDIGCYQQTLRDLRQFRPELVLTGHTRPYRTCDAWFEAIEKGAESFDRVHRALMPLGDADIHFGAESQPAKLKPYRLHLPHGGPCRFEGWILNPFPTSQLAVLRLVAGVGWESEVVETNLGPREQRKICISIEAPTNVSCRRQPIALDLTIGGRPFGQVTEALVTIGLPRF